MLNSDDSAEELTEKLDAEIFPPLKKELEVRVLVIGTTVQDSMVKESKFHKH